jgi:hypothetical protein
VDKWVETVKSFGGTQDPELWKKTLETWEETAKNSLNSQAEWTKSWIENLKSIEGMPEQAVKSVERFQEMGERWAGTQEQLWAKWIEMLKDFDPSQASERWSEAIKDPVQTWQQATQRVLDAQAEWMKIWTSSGEKTAEE